MSTKEITNARLQKFLDLKAEAARLDKEIETIKAEILAKGNFETTKFVVECKPVEKFITVDAETLCAVLSPVLVAEKNLIKTINYKLVQVKPKSDLF